MTGTNRITGRYYMFALEEIIGKLFKLTKIVFQN
jgi:hypothetical protein